MRTPRKPAHVQSITFHGEKMRNIISRCALAGLLATAPAMLAAQQQPQASPAPVTAVMAVLTVKPDANQADRAKVMPDEVTATVKLYLEGKIQQWYAKADGRGVMFILNCSSVAEAKALTDELPLIKGKFASFEFTALTPLTPLRYLMPADGGKKP